MLGLHLDVAVVDGDVGCPVQEGQVGVLAERQHQRVGVEFLDLTGGHRQPLVVELHLLDHQVAAVDPVDHREPTHRDALGERFVELIVVCGHVPTVAAVDDDGVGGTKAPRRARRVERGVAAAVDSDTTPEPGRVAVGDPVEKGDGVEDSRRIA